MQYIGLKISKAFYSISEFPSTISFPMCSVIQLCPTLQPTRLLCPWDSPGKILQWAAIFYPGDLPDPGTEPSSLASPALAGRFFTTEPPVKPFLSHSKYFIIFFYIWGIFKFFFHYEEHDINNLSLLCDILNIFISYVLRNCL